LLMKSKSFFVSVAIVKVVLYIAQFSSYFFITSSILY
jgi:hypothetical protein